jgi:hypothetical protein
MTLKDYFETTVRPKVNVVVANRGMIPNCKPLILFNEKGEPIGIMAGNQLIPETDIDIQLIEDKK